MNTPGFGFKDRKLYVFMENRANIPGPVATAVERYQARQWKILQLMQKSPAAAELAEGNPALCFALASYRTFREKFCTLDGAAIVSRRRQRDIAEWLGFPGTGAAARILSKFRPESAGVDALKSLRKMMRDPKKMKLLSHLPRLNAGVLGLVQNSRLLSAVKPALISEVAQLKCRSNTAVSAATRQTVESWLDQYALSV